VRSEEREFGSKQALLSSTHTLFWKYFFTTVWLFFVALGLGISASKYLLNGSQEELFGVFVSATLLLFGWLLFRFGLWNVADCVIGYEDRICVRRFGTTYEIPITEARVFTHFWMLAPGQAVLVWEQAGKRKLGVRFLFEKDHLFSFYPSYGTQQWFARINQSSDKTTKHLAMP